MGTPNSVVEKRPHAHTKKRGYTSHVTSHVSMNIKVHIRVVEVFSDFSVLKISLEGAII